jgi:putative ABC transport system permease protein
MLNDLYLRLRNLFRRKSVEAELDAELRFHLQEQLEKLLQSGLARDRALQRLRIEFGGIDQVKEECREARGVHMVETLIQDARFSLRTLSKSPGFTLLALLTLALGIGASTAIFSVVYGVLLRALPYEDPDGLIVLNETTPRTGVVSVSYPNFLDWRSQSRRFKGMAAVRSVAFNLAGITQPETISGEAVSPNFLSMMGVSPYLGRDFTAAEEKAGTAPVVLLTYGLWQSHFGGDPNAIGRMITLDGRGFAIVGVLPPTFRSIDKIDLLEPIGVWATNNDQAIERGGRGDMVVIGRLAASGALRPARAEMESIAARLAVAYPGSNDQCSVLLQPIRDVFVSDIRPAILVLFGAVMFVLLIACANVANLFLMRSVGRAKEIALRLALGAGRSRIVRQVLVESLVLAILGGLFSLAIAFGGIRGIVSLLPADSLAGLNVTLDGPVLSFAAVLVIVSTLLFGLAPAIASSRTDSHSELKEGSKATTSSRRQNRWRAVLVTAEVSLALVLLVGAGLMMKSLYRLLSVDPGFRADQLVMMNMSLRTQQYKNDAATFGFWRRVLDGVRALPGVESATLGTALPLTDDHERADITVENMPLPRPGSFPHPDVHVVSPNYMTTLGIPLLNGRTFAVSDDERAQHVGIINAMFARHLFHEEDPVGKRFMFGHPSATRAADWITIVGVVGDTKLYGLANPSRLEVYVPFLQQRKSHMSLVVQSRIDPAILTSSIRAVIASVDKDQPIFGITTMRSLVDNSVASRRVTLVLLGLFSMLALVLAAVGIYGVISYSVVERTHEIGIRVALGAGSQNVLTMILGQGVKIAGTGVLIGIAASLGLMRLMGSLLYSVSFADPWTFLVVPVLLTAMSMLACYIPARRMLGLDPLNALRYE